MLMWGLACLAVSPDPAWLRQLLDASVSPSQLAQLSPQHLANLLCGFVRLGVQLEGRWVAAAGAALQQREGELEELDHFHLQWAWSELNESR
jgi:hypothetical protein